jgi:hypothetical protein
MVKWVWRGASSPMLFSSATGLCDQISVAHEVLRLLARQVSQYPDGYFYLDNERKVTIDNCLVTTVTPGSVTALFGPRQSCYSRRAFGLASRWPLPVEINNRRIECVESAVAGGEGFHDRKLLEG